MFCSKCGVEILDGYEFCMKCGAKIRPIQAIDEDIQKKKSKKWLILIIIVVVVVALLVVAFSLLKGAQKRSGLYKNIPWETSFDDIKSMIEKRSGEPLLSSEGRSNASEIILDYDGDKDITAELFYKFRDDELVGITLFLFNGGDSKYTSEKLYDKYANELTDLYGDGEEARNDLKKWTTKKSLIQLLYDSDGFIVVDYYDIKKVEDLTNH